MKGTNGKAKALTEQALKDSELRYRRLFEAAQDGILILDAETGIIDDVNPYLIKMLGYSRAEFLKKKLWEVGAFKDVEASQEAFETLQAKEYIRYEDLPLKTKDGHFIQVEFVSNVYLVGDKKVIQCDVRDITEHARIVAALQENEKNYHDLINQSTDGFFVIASSGNLLTVNKAICQALGYGQEELLRMNIWDIIPKKYLDQYGKRLKKVLSGKSLSEEAEYIVQGRDGKAHYVEILSAPHYSGKDIIGFQGIARDITARKQLEVTLQEKDYIISQSQSIAHIGSWGWDLAGPIEWTEETYRIYGLSQENFTPTVESLITLIHPEDRLMMQQWLEDCRAGQSPDNFEYRAILPDGSIRFVLGSGDLIYDTKNKPVYMAGTVQDVTAYKRTEQKLADLANFPSENPNPVLRLNENGIILYANPSSDALLGMWGCALGGSAPRFWCDLVAQALASMKFKTVDVECDEKIYSLVVAPVAEPGYANIYGIDITERKQSETTLNLSESKFRSYIENAPLGLFIADQSGRYVEVNAAASEMLGYAEAELLELSISDVLAPQSLETGLQQFQKVVQDGSITTEFLFRRKDGTQFWSTVLAVKLSDDRFMSYCQDITERKLAEQELRGNETKYKTLFESVSDAIYIYDPDSFEILDANEATSKLYGYEKNELMGMSCLKFSAEVDKSKTVAAQIIKDGQANVPYRHHKKKNGSDLFVYLTGYQVMVNGQEITFAVCRDVTEYMQAQAARQESERRFRDMQENIDLIAVMLDRDGRVTFCNDYLLNLTGYSRESVLGQDWFELFVPPESDVKEGYLAGMKQGTVIGAHYENEILTSSGEHRLISWNNIILKDAEGHVIGTNSIGRDITASRRVEEALRERDRRFRALIENSADAITLVDAKGIAVYDSPAAPGMLGYDPTDWIGKDVFALIHPDDLPEIQTLFKNLANTPNERVNSTFRVRHKSGAWLWVEMVATNLLTVPGVDAIVLNYRDITMRTQAEQKIEHHIAELEALYQSGIAFSQTFDQRDIGEKLIELLIFHLDWHHAAVRVRNVDSEDIKLVAYMSPDEDRASGLNMQSVITHAGEGLAGWVIQNGKPLHINNLAEDPRYVATFDGMNSGLYIPMQTHNQIIGCISVESDQVNAFTEDDEHLLITLATQAAEAMRNAELFETIQKELAQRKLAEKQIQRQLGHLTALSSIDRAIASSLDLKFNLSEILTHVIAELEVDAASILILNSSSHMLEYGVARGFRTKVDRKSQVQLGESYAGQVALKRKLVQIPDLREEPENLLLTSPLKDEGFAFYSGSPLITKQQVKGVFQVFHRTPLEPDAEWLDFFYALAGQAAIAIETVSLFEDLQRSNTELSLAYDATIEGWSRALDLRDKETEGHTLRVTELTLTFARKVGLSEEELVNVRWGALLHDIGKLGVPDGVLLKPGPLTDEEWVKMKEHPRFAYDLLSPIRYLGQALDIPYCHHEKWDGSGYPRGLKGDQIPIVARIFAVVDVWDALTSERPYRPAWTKEKTREHIRASSGTHFDPEMVEVFLKLDLETKESSNNEK